MMSMPVSFERACRSAWTAYREAVNGNAVSGAMPEFNLVWTLASQGDEKSIRVMRGWRAALETAGLRFGNGPGEGEIPSWL